VFRVFRGKFLLFFNRRLWTDQEGLDFVSIRPATAERITISPFGGLRTEPAGLVWFFLHGSFIIQTVKSLRGFVRDYLPESNFVKIEITDVGG
jgi:hypothetical protein